MYLHWIEQMQKIEKMNVSWLNLIDTFWFVWRLVISIIVFTLVIATWEVGSKDVHVSWFLIALDIMKVAIVVWFIGVVNIVVFFVFEVCKSLFLLFARWVMKHFYVCKVSIECRNVALDARGCCNFLQDSHSCKRWW
jgi:hypothetical protein